MGKTFTLDSLREEAERKYSPVVVVLSDGTEVQLLNLLRLGKKDRDKVIAKLKELEGDGGIDAIGGVVTDVLTVIGGANGKKLVAELGDDVALMMQVLEAWMDSSQPGEAQSSQS